jgi:uncharacterized protein YjdB
MKVGDTFRPTINVVPADATNADLYHFSANGAVKDNKDGSFTALKAGTYTLKVTMDGMYMMQPPFTTFTLTIEE